MQSRGEEDSNVYSSRELYDSAGSVEFADKNEENESLKTELEELKTQVQQYKFVSQSFEKRVLDLQMELIKKDEEIKTWKEKYEKCLAKKGSEHTEEVEDSEMMRKLFVGGLNQTTTDEMLHQYFSKYGTLINAVVMKDSFTKKSRGFGFVIFASSSMLDAAQADRPHTVDDKVVDTKRAVPKGAPSGKASGVQSKRIFIGGLKATTQESSLVDYFSRFGAVESVSVLEDKQTNRNRGFAYITFYDSDTTDKVVLQKFHNIDGRRCEVKPAISKIVLKGTEAGNAGNMDSGILGNFAGMMGVPVPGNVGRSFVGPIGSNFPGFMGGNCGPAFGHMEHKMEMNHGHCCNSGSHGHHSCGAAPPVVPVNEVGGCQHCAHAENGPQNHNFVGLGWKQGRGNPGGWHNGGASRSPVGMDNAPGIGRGGAFGGDGPHGRGEENYVRGDGTFAGPMGRGEISPINFRGDPGSGKPIRNTGHFLQRGTGPY